MNNEGYERKGFLDGLSVLETILDRLNDEDHSYCIENAYEDLRDYRDSVQGGDE